MGAVVRELYVFRQRGRRRSSVESAWFRRGDRNGGVTGMQREVKGRLRCWREKPGTGWRSRQNRDSASAATRQT